MNYYLNINLHEYKNVQENSTIAIWLYPLMDFFLVLLHTLPHFLGFLSLCRIPQLQTDKTCLLKNFTEIVNE